jgi:hypothetical protein
MGLTFNLGRVSPSVFTDSSLNVGIGAAPSGSYKLEVTGTAKVSSTLLVSGALTGAAATFSGTLTANGTIIQNSSQDLGTSAYFSANVTNGFRVLNAANTIGLLTITNAGAATFSSSVNMGGDLALTPNDSAITFSSGAGRFFTGGAERMRILANGRVGINTTAPDARLEVQLGSGTTTAGLFYNYTGDVTATLMISRCGTTSGFYHFQAFSTTTTEVFRIESNGNVKNSNNSYGSLSDIKIKDNVTDATPKLEDLLKVRIRNYNIIGQDVKQIGVIAQELEEIFPSMVDENEDFEEIKKINEEGNSIIEKKSLGTFTKSVKYSVFVPMLIKAIQEQQAQIEELKAMIAAK